MSLSDIANTSQGPMVGDYISTSFNQSGRATSAFAVGLPHTAAQLFDEGTYAPATPLAVTPPASAGNVASSAGAQAITGQGTGEAQHTLRDE
jgi:hypothetical protein